MQSQRSIGYVGLLLVSLASIFLCYFADRSAPYPIVAAALVGGLGWYLAIEHVSLQLAVTVGLSLRVIAVFSMPLLSEDILRFLWDGELWLAGIHPLDYVPERVPEAFAKTHPDLLAGMNSAGYFTIYPSVGQAIFAVSAYLGDTAAHSTWILKSILFTGEVVLLYLISRYPNQRSEYATKAYALCLLPIVEICGNAHFEGLACVGVLLALLAFRQNRPLLTGIGLAFGALVKLVPLVAAPAFAFGYLFWRKPQSAGDAWKQTTILTLTTTLLTVGGLAAFVWGADVSGFGKSLDLYFRSFEFNGSLYTLAASVGSWWVGYNWIAVVGPSLAALSLTAILAISLFGNLKHQPIEQTLLWCFAVYLACATTVHPWYAIYLLALGVLTPYRWPVLLSFTVFLSYLAYGRDVVEVPDWALLLEYLVVVGVMIWEVKVGRKCEVINS